MGSLRTLGIWQQIIYLFLALFLQMASLFIGQVAPLSSRLRPHHLKKYLLKTRGAYLFPNPLLFSFLVISLLITSCQTGQGSGSEETTEVDTSAPIEEIAEELPPPTSELSDCIPCDPEGPCAPAYAAFKKMHPEVTDYICCKRRSMRDKWCEFIYNVGPLIMEVEFSESGDWLETEEENLHVEEVPEAVLADLSKRFPKGKIIKCERETTPTGNFYEIDLRFPDGGENEYYYTPGGVFLVGQNRYED